MFWTTSRSDHQPCSFTSNTRSPGVAKQTMPTSVSTTTVTTAVDPTKEIHHANSEEVSHEQASSDYDRFFWTYTEEPHKSRRQAIIKAHPEVAESRISCSKEKSV